MTTDKTVALVDRARRFAALSGPFDPVALLDALGRISDAEAMDVTIDLASVCDTSDTDGWLIRGTVRRDQLDTLSTAGALKSAITWRRRRPVDPATGDLLAALSAAEPYTEAGVAAALMPPIDSEALTRMVVALDRAGRHASVRGSVEALRASLGSVDADSRAQAVRDRGFFGRHAETIRAEAWLSKPATEAPVKAMLIDGVPGSGKATLIDEVARRASAQNPPWIIVRLDFDRGGLDIQDRVGLTIEISRQVARELGPDGAGLRPARLLAAGAGSSTGPNVKGGARDHIPEELWVAVGEAVLVSGRPVLLILSTLDVLRARGETHPIRLFETIDQLCERGLRPIAVIAAGGGQALDRVPDRVGDRIELAGLDNDSANRLLRGLGVDDSLFGRIREVSGNIPLVLRVAALAVQQSGPEAFDGVTARRDEAVTYLYRSLLSRIGDPEVQALMRPILMVRRIHPDLIAEVLAPHAGLKKFGHDEAVTAFETLAGQDWLVEPDTVAGWVRHRSDVRRSLLESLYAAEKPTAAARLDRAVAHWFDSRAEAFAPVEAAYHRLQELRVGGDPPALAPQILNQLDDETLDELPVEARDVVQIRRGARSSNFRAQTPSSRPDLKSAAVELELTLERTDVLEAQYIYDRSFARKAVDPVSPAADVARTHLWRAGRWSEVGDVDPVRYFDGPFRERSQTVTLAHFEMWAEFRFDELERALRARPELAQLATELRSRGLGGSLGTGALGFALRRAGVAQPRGSWSIGDPVEAAAVLWAPTTTWKQGAPDTAVLDALAMQASRFTSRVSASAGNGAEAAAAGPRLADLSTPAGAARVLASATPYASVVDALLTLDHAGTVQDSLLPTDRMLAEAGAIPPFGAGDWRITPAISHDGALDSIAALGLLAEWLSASAFALKQPDVALIAASAERWRRTCAGEWAYSSRETIESAWSQAPDASIRDRVAQLHTKQDCLEQIQIWIGATDPARILQSLRRRYAAADRAARQAETSDAAAAVLLAAEVPSAFVPAMAVLATTEGKKSP